MNFDTEKIKIASKALHNACMQCGKAHRNDCPISVAGAALKTVE